APMSDTSRPSDRISCAHGDEKCLAADRREAAAQGGLSRRIITGGLGAVALLLTAGGGRGAGDPLTPDLSQQTPDDDAKPVAPLQHNSRVLSAAFSPDSRRILTTCRDATARLWDGDGRPLPTIFQGHGSAVQSCAFSPDGLRILTGSTDKTARLWDRDGK